MKEFTIGQSKMLSPKIIELLNFRINQEELSSRIYKAMALWLEDKNYEYSAKLWHKYSSEELKHAEWAREHLLSFNIRPETRPIESVPQNFNGLDDIIYQTLDHELLISNQCKELTKAALEESDFWTFELGNKYNAEQIEELNKSYSLVNLLDVYGTEKLNLALLDHHLESWL